MNGRVYTLIKEYPGSPDLGAQVIGGDIGTCGYSAYRGAFRNNVTFSKPMIENFPEFWQSKATDESTVSN